MKLMDFQSFYVYIKYLYVFCLHLIQLSAEFIFAGKEGAKYVIPRRQYYIPGHVSHEQGVPTLYIIDLTRIRTGYKHFYDDIF